MNIFEEASDNIRVMHEIETILDNDDIPARSRSHFLKFISISYSRKLSKKQQNNVRVFRELFIRIDKDTRLVRTFLNVAIDLAVHFNIEDSPFVYAFRNLSLEEHFINFVDFAKRKNPIIEKNNPLKLVLSLGISLVRLALKKNKMSAGRKNEIDTKKRDLLLQYQELSKEMSERFIEMDFSDEILGQEDVYSKDLDGFNRDDDEDEEDEEVIKENPSQQQHTDIDADEEVDNKPIIVQAEVHPMPAVPKLYSIDEEQQQNATDDDEEDVLSLNAEDDISYMFDEMLAQKQQDAQEQKESNDGDILKPLENGDRELNLNGLDSLFMAAGRQFGPAVLNSISTNTTDKEKNKPLVRFNNTSIQSIVDFIH